MPQIGSNMVRDVPIMESWWRCGSSNGSGSNIGIWMHGVLGEWELRLRKELTVM